KIAALQDNQGERRMTEKLSDLHRAKRGMAAIVVCLAQAASENDPTFQDRFMKRLAEAYAQFKDDTDGDVIQELELISWTRQYLTGWNPITGQGKPLGG